jgi:glutamine phosphoribosylpyrophosphate amidotransferase
VDDSIVRGNTIKPIVQLLRYHGAKEVHIRVASPPIRHPCFMGINIPTKDELIINKIPKGGCHGQADHVKKYHYQLIVTKITK